MALTTQRKVFLGVLCVAGASLFIDQGLLSGPSTASAADPFAHEGDPINDTPGVAALGSIDPRLGAAIGTLRGRLGGFESPRETPDITQMFFARVDEQPEPDQGASNERDARPVGLPVLSAVMPAPGGRGSAVLDGTLVAVGDRTRAGDTLVRVVARRAVLERDGREYTVSLPVRN